MTRKGCGRDCSRDASPKWSIQKGCDEWAMMNCLCHSLFGARIGQGPPNVEHLCSNVHTDEHLNIEHKCSVAPGIGFPNGC